MTQVAGLCIQKAHYAAQEIAKLPGYSLLFPDKPFFKEFVVRTPVAPARINEHLLSEGIIGGLDLGQHFPDMGDAVLLCVTEQRTKEDIDALVSALGTF